MKINNITNYNKKTKQLCLELTDIDIPSNIKSYIKSNYIGELPFIQCANLYITDKDEYIYGYHGDYASYNIEKLHFINYKRDDFPLYALNSSIHYELPFNLTEEQKCLVAEMYRKIKEYCINHEQIFDNNGDLKNTIETAKILEELIEEEINLFSSVDELEREY